MRIPHQSALSDEVVDHFSDESKRKVASKSARLVLYDEIKGDIPKQVKVSPISATPHNSKAFRSILALSFLLELTPQVHVTSVNKNRKKTATGGAIDHIWHLILCLIRAFST